MPEPLRVGVVGIGGMGMVHVECHANSQDVTLAAVAGKEQDTLDALGTRFEGLGLYEDWQDLVARDDLDAISIVTPNSLHMPIAVAALASGKHVLCEKPLALSAVEAHAMQDAAVKAGRVLMTVFDKRFRGDVQVLRSRVEAGELGEVHYARGWWMRRRGVPSNGTWFTDKLLAGGGPLIDLGVHALDLALVLLGEPVPVAVSASTYSEVAGFEVEDLATAFIRFANGATLQLEASWSAHGSHIDDLGVALYGSRGGAKLDVVDYATSDTLTLYTDVDGVPTDTKPEVGSGMGHWSVVQRFHQVVRSGDWGGHTGQPGVARAEIIEACYASAASGAEVRLDQATT
jgi:predicted dehydrogenase